jgi:molybdopterin-guanine dinucleotide biosynthesis protein A
VVVQAPLSARPVGFVVAGGRSSRMGRDKALLPWQGSTLLDHAIARLSAVCGEVRILCGPARRYEDRGRPLVVDAVPDGGPLAGIAAGLDSAGDAAGLYLGVDLPFVTVALLAALAQARQEDADALVPVTPAGPEPLCAVYRPGCRRPVHARLAAGDRRMTSFWPDVRVWTLEGQELAAFGGPSRIFHNVNAPGDYLGLAGDAKEHA